MKKIFIISFLVFVATAAAWAEDFLLDVHVYAKVNWKTLDGKQNSTLDISEALIYISEADGSVRRGQVFLTQPNGQLLHEGREGKSDHRILLDKAMGGRYVVNYVVCDGLRYERNSTTGQKEWQYYDPARQEYVMVKNPRSIPGAYHGSYTLDLNAQQGSSITVPFLVNLSADDKAYYAGRLNSAKVKGRVIMNSGLGPQGDDGARVGKYENFSVRFLVPRDSLQPHHRIVAQPIWIDRTEGLTYYGDPLAYYGKTYGRSRVRESSFAKAHEQQGMPFYKGYINAPYAYEQDHAAADDPLRDFSLTHREELHYPRHNFGGKRAEDSLYFRLPLYIKVDESMADNDCLALVNWVITDYNKILYSASDTLIEGRSDPLRYLRYNVGGLLDEQMRDNNSNNYWFPESMNGSHDEDCSLRIFFETGKTALDWSKANNEAQRQEALATINRVRRTPDSYIRAVYITGYASPDGRAEYNNRLAAGRTLSFKQWLGQAMPEASQYIYESSKIAPWSMVADTLRMWGKMEGEIGDYASEQDVRQLFPDNQDPTLRAALDAVRVITFRITYEIQAAYTVDQLEKIYDTNNGHLTQDFMYRDVYRHRVEHDDLSGAERMCRQIYDEKLHTYRKNVDHLLRLREEYNRVSHQERLARQALESDTTQQRMLTLQRITTQRDSVEQLIGQEMNACHEILLYANDLCAIKLMRGEGDTLLLKPFTTLPDCRLRDRRHYNASVLGVPDVVLLNQAAAYLTCKRPGWARTYMDFYNRRKYPDINRSTANDKVRQLQDVIAVKASTTPITREQIRSIEAIHPINGVLGVLAMSDPTAEDFAHARQLVTDPTLMNDSLATDNIVRALWYGRDFSRRNESYKLSPSDYYDSDLEQGARYLRMALTQDPGLHDMAYSQRDLRPIFKVLNRIKRDEQVINNIKVTRRNRAKEE